MPKAYVPLKVRSALDVLEDFFEDKEVAVKRVAQPRDSDMGWGSERAEKQSDRVRYHKSCVDAVRQRVLDTIADTF